MGVLVIVLLLASILTVLVGVTGMKYQLWDYRIDFYLRYAFLGFSSATILAFIAGLANVLGVLPWVLGFGAAFVLVVGGLALIARRVR